MHFFLKGLIGFSISFTIGLLVLGWVRLWCWLASRAEERDAKKIGNTWFLRKNTVIVDGFCPKFSYYYIEMKTPLIKGMKNNQQVIARIWEDIAFPIIMICTCVSLLVFACVSTYYAPNTPHSEVQVNVVR